MRPVALHSRLRGLSVRAARNRCVPVRVSTERRPSVRSSTTHENTSHPAAAYDDSRLVPLFHPLHLSTWHVRPHPLHFAHIGYLNDEPSCNRCRLSRQINWLSRAATSLNRCCCCSCYRWDVWKPMVMSGNRAANCASILLFRYTLHKAIVNDRLIVALLTFKAW